LNGSGFAGSGGYIGEISDITDTSFTILLTKVNSGLAFTCKWFGITE